MGSGEGSSASEPDADDAADTDVRLPADTRVDANSHVLRDSSTDTASCGKRPFPERDRVTKEFLVGLEHPAADDEEWLH